MTRDQAIRILHDHAGEIRARGVTRLALFGSTVRGGARADSDVDLLVDIDRRRKFSLLDQAGLQIFLGEMLDCEVEVATRDGLKPFLKDNILAEAVEVFPELGRRNDVEGESDMPRRNPRQPLEDMLEAVDAIDRFLAGKSFADYLATDIMRAAVERNIEIISEASRQIPKDLTARHPGIAWKDIAGIGNILRHGYEIIEDERIWAVARGRRSDDPRRRAARREEGRLLIPPPRHSPGRGEAARPRGSASRLAGLQPARVGGLKTRPYHGNGGGIS
ncbi:MAG: HepT-like ribonuclease domain-containing protein [Pseudomonadota bacterium]